jgi:hypothetical protein
MNFVEIVITTPVIISALPQFTIIIVKSFQRLNNYTQEFHAVLFMEQETGVISLY